MLQHVSKSRFITTKVVAAGAFKAALVFISILVMLIITSLNRISVFAATSVAAAANAAYLRSSIKFANFRSEFCAKQYGS